MNTLIYISNIIMPIIIGTIIILGIGKKINVYDSFAEGAFEGLKTVLNILPTLIGLMTAVSVLRASGFLDLFTLILRPFAQFTGFPSELLPLITMRLVSSSAAMGMLMDIYSQFGPDSFLGRLSSVIMSCTETVFYTLSVYFMSVNIKNTRYTLSGAILSNIAGVAASFFIVLFMFGK